MDHLQAPFAVVNNQLNDPTEEFHTPSPRREVLKWLDGENLVALSGGEHTFDL